MEKLFKELLMKHQAEITFIALDEMSNVMAKKIIEGKEYEEEEVELFITSLKVILKSLSDLKDIVKEDMLGIAMLHTKLMLNFWEVELKSK